MCTDEFVPPKFAVWDGPHATASPEPGQICQAPSGDMKPLNDRGRYLRPSSCEPRLPRQGADLMIASDSRTVICCRFGDSDVDGNGW